MNVFHIFALVASIVMMSAIVYDRHRSLKMIGHKIPISDYPLYIMALLLCNSDLIFELLER